MVKSLIILALFLNFVSGRELMPRPREVVITFAGDVYPQVLKGAPGAVLQKLRDRTAGSHLIFCNLESPITSHNVRTPGKKARDLSARKDFALRSDRGTGILLKKAGFNVAGLANNHVMDYTGQGLMDTMEELDSLGIRFCGAGKNRADAESPVLVDAGGARAAFMSFSEIAPPLSHAGEDYCGIAAISYPPGDDDLQRISRSVQAARGLGADFVIVSLHWGKEGSSRMEAYQQKFARQIIDSGADCVIGHHPHVVRDVESYKGSVIAYSLGNYIFSSSDRKTRLLRVKFKENLLGFWTQEWEELECSIKNCIPTG
jgi:poly-gamma-glutamate synthesis protein (capsule biosynthesis protein)